MSMLNRYGIFPRGTSPFPYRRKADDLRRAMPEMVLAARRTERRKQHLRLG